MNEKDFYDSGIFRGAIELLRGSAAATMRHKREFARHVFNKMQDGSFITDWTTSGGANRHDYTVTMPSGRTAVIELKGCMDGNNTTIFERPNNANEFIIWSLCPNKGSDPRKNAWSGIHVRLGAEIISRSVQVDGLIIWDMLCGTEFRPCPKLRVDSSRTTELGSHQLPPPCIYLFPSTIPSPRNNPKPRPQELKEVHFLEAFAKCFGAHDEEVISVEFEVQFRGSDVFRTTTITKNGLVNHSSKPSSIKRAG